MKTKSNKRPIIISTGVLGLTAVAMTLGFQNCSSSATQFTQSGSTTSVAAAGSVTPQSTGTPAPIVCDPFQNGATSVSDKNGILATLTYLPPTSSVITAGLSTASFAPGSKDVQSVATSIYLSQFSVFTQDFTLGFQSSSGDDLKDNNGQVLDQYFSLRVAGQIGLDQSNLGGISEAGYYQLAILSDDGSNLQVADANGNYSTLINNDGDHSNRFQCAAQAIYLQAGQQIPYKLNYFQGPPVRISMMMFARKVDPSNAATFADPLCANTSLGTTEGDTYFFTESSNTLAPVPTTAYVNSVASNQSGILNRGWEVLPAANFFLPNQDTNPCSEQSTQGLKSRYQRAPASL